MTDSTKLTVERKLNGANWRDWAWETESILRRSKVWRVVTGDETQPTGAAATPAALSDWYHRVDTASGIITGSIETSQRIHVEAIRDDPKAMWDTLKAVHNQQLPVTRVNAYLDLLSIHREEDETFSALIARMEAASKLTVDLCPKDFKLETLDDDIRSRERGMDTNGDTKGRH